MKYATDGTTGVGLYGRKNQPDQVAVQLPTGLSPATLTTLGFELQYTTSSTDGITIDPSAT